MTRTATDAWDVLATVPDPEIPALSVVDLGIVRGVDESADHRRVHVVITPTYSGCPATEVIQRDIRSALEAMYDEVVIDVRLSPAWTTQWLTDAGRVKLREHGIAPPGKVELGARIPVGAPAEQPDACPVCGGADVEEIAQFGSTPCQALWRCVTCREPFGYFKNH